MVNQQQKGVLMMMSKEEVYSESWLLRQGNLTQTDLNDLVEKECLIRVHKNPEDFMSENRYKITEIGQRIAWNK